MKKFFEVIIKAIMVFGLIAVLLIWLVDLKFGSPLFIILSFAIVLIGVWVVARDYLQRRSALAAGEPLEDEFSDNAKVYAGSKAFNYSMYLWLFIFIVHYRFPSPESMLGVGVIGSALIYGLWLWYYKSTGAFSNE